MKQKKVLTLILCGLFSAFIALCSWICIPTPLPFTFQTFAVFLVALILPFKASFLTVLCYIAVGVAGLPVFAGFRGGLEVLLGSTGGFLMGFIISAPLISLLCSKIKAPNKRLVKYISCLAGLLVCYICGGIWFAIVSDTTVLAGFIWEAPFIPLDLIKIAIAVEISTILNKKLIW